MQPPLFSPIVDSSASTPSPSQFSPNPEADFASILKLKFLHFVAHKATEEIFQLKKKLSGRNWLKAALQSSELLSDVDGNVLDRMCSRFVRRELKEGEKIISTKQIKSELCMLETGEIKFYSNGFSTSLNEKRRERWFNRPSVFFGYPSVSEVFCKKDGTVIWEIDKDHLDPNLIQRVQSEICNLVGLLLRNPEIPKLHHHVLYTAACCLQRETFGSGEVVFLENSEICPFVSDKFYLVSKGSVVVTAGVEVDGGTRIEKELATLRCGQYFGEAALMHNVNRTATVRACEQSTICYSLHKGFLFQFLGKELESGADNFHQYKSEQVILTRRRSQSGFLFLNRISFGRVIGCGGYSIVYQVKNQLNQKFYAMKVMNKQMLIEREQQDHVNNERNILAQTSHPFIINFIRTFQDENKIYMMTELIPGGELFSLMRKRKGLPVEEVKFYAACVVEAVDYLHKRRLIYRDLKLENIVITATGYIKLVDFGFARHLQSGDYASTLCGTPEVLAPESFANYNLHSFPVDIWALGVLIFELSCQHSPFLDETFEKVAHRVFQGVRGVNFDLLDINCHDPRDKKELMFILSKMWVVKPKDRSTIFDIRRFSFFKEYSWVKLRECKYEAPWKPELEDASDTTYFSVSPEEIQKVNLDLPFRNKVLEGIDPFYDW
eukprot:maker-scaffold_8-snap-gene-10.56-mRNA-1 protein AED:0.20 eAED:0.21 QI:0/0/0/0.62/1/1/8/0/664